MVRYGAAVIGIDVLPHRCLDCMMGKIGNDPRPSQRWMKRVCAVFRPYPRQTS
ncbi:hypothetical protein SJ05684_c32720 [Sinorhizobium sojae CCBAU 05684]|uniref:Uncharacterized protein n=1 Tax=Sinorhizobium sojae CCBAU 05684 TaxID=716928 RepID=A0A249PG94_9HYPH|nr:hypothetical protein SJ05684_c32720 [Sinorhizobium sojae CCBAU 05684]